MYEYLKLLLNAAESVGVVETAELYKRSNYRADGVDITGRTKDGKLFSISMRLEDEGE